MTRSDGTSYVADRAYRSGSWGYAGGERLTTDEPIKDTGQQAVYRSAREGMTSYRFGVPDGRYEVTLEFAELRRIGEFGRIMDIVAEGDLIANNLDLAGDVGRFRAHPITREIRVRDGELDLRFIQAHGLPPLVNGIRVTWVGRL